VGSLADKYGRKRLSMCYGIIYGISCITKLSSSFWVLLFGRLLGGVATSLLFSVFEAWMVHEHSQRGFLPEYLSRTFSSAILGNGIVAILAGIVASFVSVEFGYVAPFMVSLALLLMSSVVISFTWNENYGDSEMVLGKIFSGAVDTLRKDICVALLGTIQSLFESSMYVFVFMWTPMLNTAFEEFADRTRGLHGLIFASFMVMLMLGSSLFRFFERKWNVEQVYLGTLFVSTILFFIIAIFEIGPILYISFMLFEICCGMHFTCIGTLRSKYIPEESRAAVMNLFRVPLNILVCYVLYSVDSFSNQMIFGICGIWLAISTFCQYYLSKQEPRPIISELNLSKTKRKKKN